MQQENAAYEKNSAFDCKFSASNELIVPVREPLIEGTRIPIGTVEEYMLDSDRLVRMIYSNNAVERITDTSWRIRLVSVRARCCLQIVMMVLFETQASLFNQEHFHAWGVQRHSVLSDAFIACLHAIEFVKRVPSLRLVF